MPDLPTPLGLADRPGLPDTLAHLRARYPAAAWAAHPNYGQLTAFWLGVHAHLRTAGDELTTTLKTFQRDPADATGFGARFVPQLNTFLGHLDQHHRIEDRLYFPKFRALDPRLGASFDLLESDHAVIHHALETAVGSARQLVASLSGPGPHAADRHADDIALLTRLLVRHLADEEEIVVPAMLEHGERAVS